MTKKRISREEARRWAQEGAQLLFDGQAKKGHPLEAGQGDLKTEEDVLQVRENIEETLMREIEREYILYD